MTAADSAHPAGSLAGLRAEIEQVDAGLVALIEERVRLARAVGEAKRRLGVAMIDEPREQAVVAHATELARTAGLDETAVSEIFQRIIHMSRAVQAEGR